MEELGIAIKFHGQKQEFEASQAAIERSINILKKDVKRLNQDLKLDPSNIRVLSEKFKNLKQQENLARRSLKSLNAELGEINKRTKDPFDKEYSGKLKEIEKMDKKLLDIRKQLKNVTDGFAEAEDETMSFAEAMNKAGDSVKGLGDNLSPISNAAAGYLKSVANSAIEFEDAFADVRKTVNGTDEELDQLSVDLRKLATEVPTTATDLAHIAGLAGQMNVPTEQIVDFTRSMVDFANSTNISAEEATQEIAQIYNVIGKGGDYSSLDNLLSTIVELGNNTATTEKDIVDMFKNISAASSRVGMTESQMAALAATLSSLGLDKGGASAISKIMSNIDIAVDQNTGMLKEWANVAGMEVKEFKELWNEDAASGILAVVEGIAKSEEEGKSFNETLEDLNIKELRQIDTLSRLTNANADYARNLSLADSAYAEGTALSEEAAKRYETVASQIQVMKNNFMEFALALGDTLLPYIEYLVQAFKDLADWLNGLEPHTKLLISRILVITASLAPLLKLVGSGMKAFATLSTVLGKIVPIATKIASLISKIIPLLGSIVKAVFTYIGANTGLIAVIVFVVAGFVALYKNCEPFRNLIDNLIGKIKDLWKQFKKTNYIEVLGEKFGWFGEIIGLLLEGVKKLVTWFGSLLKKMGKFLGLASDVNDTNISVTKGVRSYSGGVSGISSLGSVSVQNSFSINNTSNITESQVRSWANIITDQVNENLGKMV